MASKLPVMPVILRRTRTTFDLTAAQRSFLNVMQENQFGRIENVPVHGGQPVLDQSVKIVRVARLGDGLIVRLEFRDGLPLLVETAAAAAPEDRRRLRGKSK